MVEKVNIVEDLLYSQKLFKRAEELYNSKVNQHVKESGKNRDREYFEKMTREGTAGDKINAHAELIKMFPEVSLAHIKSLLEICKKNNRRLQEQAVIALKGAFLSAVLQDDAKLWVF